MASNGPNERGIRVARPSWGQRPPPSAGGSSDAPSPMRWRWELSVPGPRAKGESDQVPPSLDPWSRVQHRFGLVRPLGATPLLRSVTLEQASRARFAGAPSMACDKAGFFSVAQSHAPQSRARIGALPGLGQARLWKDSVLPMRAIRSGQRRSGRRFHSGAGFPNSGPQPRRRLLRPGQHWPGWPDPSG